MALQGLALFFRLHQTDEVAGGAVEGEADSADRLTVIADNLVFIVLINNWIPDFGPF